MPAASAASRGWWWCPAPRRCRQVTARLGVREVRRRAGRGGAAGTAAAACRTATGVALLGARRDRCGSGFGIAEEDPSRGAAASSRRALDGSCPTRTEQALRRRPGWGACSACPSRRHRGRPRPGGAVRRLAAVLRAAGGRQRPGGAARSRTPSTPTTALLDFLEHLVDWARDLPIFVLVFARPELTRPPTRLGRRAATGPRSPSTRSTSARCATLVDALVPRHARRRRSKRSSSRPRASRCSPSRPSAHSSTATSSCRSRACTGWSATSASSSVPDSLHALLAARLDALDPRTPVPGRRRGRARHELPGRSAGRACPAGRRARSAGPGRAAPPRGARGLRRPALAPARRLPLQPGHAAPGRVRDLVAPGPQGAAPRGRRAPAAGVSPTTARRSSTSSPGTTSTPWKLPDDPTARSASARSPAWSGRRSDRTGRAPRRGRHAPSNVPPALVADTDMLEAARLLGAGGTGYELAGQFLAAYDAASRARETYLERDQPRAAARALSEMGLALKGRAG